VFDISPNPERAVGTDFSIRPAGALATVSVPTPVRAPANAVRTELPSHKAITAAASSAAAQPVVGNDVLSRQVVIDTAAASLVYQVVDERSDTVVKQFPEQAVLRRRAYLRALDTLKDDAARSERDVTA
jgi:hypothetical protein